MAEALSTVLRVQESLRDCVWGARAGVSATFREISSSLTLP